MATTAALLSRLRLELGDQGRPFQVAVVSDGLNNRFDLPQGRIDPTSFSVMTITPANQQPAPYSEDAPQTPIPSGGTVANLVAGTDYTLDADNSILTMTTTPPSGTTIVASGNTYTLFSDTELQMFLDTALTQQTHGRVVRTRTRDANTGWVSYTNTPVDYTNLMPVEEYPLVILAQIEALWVLANETAQDTDVNTAEGTVLPRTQRYAQIRQQIDALQDRYQGFANQLGVGLNRIEVFTLRRRSRTTNRLVPIYVEREYDEYDYPVRVIPPVDTGQGAGSTSVEPWSPTINNPPAPAPLGATATHYQDETAQNDFKGDPEPYTNTGVYPPPDYTNVTPL